MFTAMSRRRLEPGSGKSPRFTITFSDAQRQALDELSATTGRSAAELAREAVAAWLAAQPKEMPKAS
jgi:predicted transcriptional regulator